MKEYTSKRGARVTWESNSMAMWQSIQLYGYGDKSSPNYVRLSIDLTAAPNAPAHIRRTDKDYRVDLRPAFAPLPDKPYPANLHAEMVYNSLPPGYGGKSAPDKILIWGLRGAVATTFYPKH